MIAIANQNIGIAKPAVKHAFAKWLRYEACFAPSLLGPVYHMCAIAHSVGGRLRSALVGWVSTHAPVRGLQP